MKASFILPDGQEIQLDVPAEVNLMRAATGNGIPGIVADCGGSASCATCHVFVDPAFLDLLPPVGPNEDQMLDCTAADRAENSRLSCQIVMTEALEGIRVRIADPQL